MQRGFSFLQTIISIAILSVLLLGAWYFYDKSVVGPTVYDVQKIQTQAEIDNLKSEFPDAVDVSDFKNNSNLKDGESVKLVGQIEIDPNSDAYISIASGNQSLKIPAPSVSANISGGIKSGDVVVISGTIKELNSVINQSTVLETDSVLNDDSLVQKSIDEDITIVIDSIQKSSSSSNSSDSGDGASNGANSEDDSESNSSFDDSQDSVDNSQDFEIAPPYTGSLPPEFYYNIFDINRSAEVRILND